MVQMHVIVITLHEATDRQEKVSAMLTSLKLPFQFYFADRHPLGGIVGNFDSHVRAWQLAWSLGYPIVLICEDDIITTPSFGKAEIWKELDSLMVRDDPRWEIIQLGYGPTTATHANAKFHDYDFSGLYFSESTSKHIRRYMGLLSHAYLMSRIGLSKMIPWGLRHLSASPQTIERPRKERPYLDRYMVTELSTAHTYCTVPMLFEQDWCQPTYNDYEGSWTDTHGRKLYCDSKRQWLYYWSVIAYYKYTTMMTLALLIILLILYLSYIIYMNLKRRSFKKSFKTNSNMREYR